MKATNNKDSTSSRRMVPLTSEDVPLMLTTCVQGPTSAASSLFYSNVPNNLIFNVQDVLLEERERASPSENKPCSQADTLLKKSCPGGHLHQKDVPLKKQKPVETGGNQTLQVATWTSLTPAGGGSALPPPRAISLVADPPRRSTSSDTSMDELSPALMGAIQRIVSAVIREQLAVLTPARTTTPSDEDVPEEVAEEGAPVHMLPITERQGPLLVASQEVPPQWLARFECLQKGLQDVQY
ncbi:UNVERIFIED_CONTAM: hypothetical protein Slati_2739800 [Sesamum latifolium]|uniref:Uncharacterized protein n=1 Tax=Sesamum latifolium TaxID=2727402 RepID=A0AAW2W185_9LAMI